MNASYEMTDLDLFYGPPDEAKIIESGGVWRIKGMEGTHFVRRRVN